MGRAILSPLVVVAVGILWVLMLGTIFGALLVLAGMGALLVVALPGAVERIAELLSNGKVRRSPRK